MGIQRGGPVVENKDIHGGIVRDESLTGEDIKNNSLESDDIADGTIQSIDIADGTITGSDIANYSVTWDKLNIPNNVVPGAVFVDGAINGAKILDGTITNLDIANSTITGAKVATGTLTSTNILDGTIQNIDIANSTITGTKIAGSTLTSSHILDGTIVDADISASANIDATKINWETVPVNAIAPSIPEGLYFENHPSCDGLSNYSITNGNSTISTFYLPYPLQMNFFTYAVYTGGSGWVRGSLYNSAGVRIYDTGLLNSLAGTFKLSTPSIKLQPGVYYAMFVSSSGSIKFYTCPSQFMGTIPHTGLYFIGYGSSNLPTQIDFSNINTNNNKQPWLMISKY